MLQLPDTTLSRERNLPRFQREAMVFAPGESSHQSFRAEFFDALCGQCHGSLSGRPLDIALKPDFVTQASADALARQGAVHAEQEARRTRPDRGSSRLSLMKET